MYKEFLEKLKDNFNCNFDIEERHGFIVIYCENESVAEDKNNIPAIVNIAKEYIEEEMLWNIAIISDKYRGE